MSLRERSAVERAENFVAFGPIHCDVCHDLPSGERPDEGEFWPEEPISYLNEEASMAFEFWHLTVCDHHDPEEPPEEATHRVVFETSSMEDHRMNSATERKAIDVEEL